ncbi:hypothetical protein F5I97DRAFT_1827424 [Phlebopus sp. FC_14]|nr:hypothetical protein F5I97DRAFT_1827424 [Phlebopus sp. FC_14]
MTIRHVQLLAKYSLSAIHPFLSCVAVSHKYLNFRWDDNIQTILSFTGFFRKSGPGALPSSNLDLNYRLINSTQTSTIDFMIDFMTALLSPRYVWCCSAAWHGSMSMLVLLVPLRDSVGTQLAIYSSSLEQPCRVVVHNRGAPGDSLSVHSREQDGPSCSCVQRNYRVCNFLTYEGAGVVFAPGGRFGKPTLALKLQWNQTYTDAAATLHYINDKDPFGLVGR